jgi:mRNA-degrading endonuclease RelE of RelBE toxin-antitoxin system
MFDIQFAESVTDDLKLLRAYDRRFVLDRINAQLRHEPATDTKAKKVIVGLQPPWQHQPPVLQLRVGDFRVFYDVNLAESRVVIRAIRRKNPHQTTEAIL